MGGSHPTRSANTVATLVSGRVNAEAASQQARHSSPAITRGFHVSKPAIAADVSHVLDEWAVRVPGAGLNTSGTAWGRALVFK